MLAAATLLYSPALQLVQGPPLEYAPAGQTGLADATSDHVRDVVAEVEAVALAGGNQDKDSEGVVDMDAASEKLALSEASAVVAAGDEVCGPAVYDSEATLLAAEVLKVDCDGLWDTLAVAN